MNNTPLDALVLSLKGNTGNKNIFAASLVIKLAFVMYCVYTLKRWLRVFYVAVLCVGMVTVWLINARSAYLGLVVEVGLLVVFIVLKALKDKQIKTHLSGASLIVLPLVFSFCVAQFLFNGAQQMTGVSVGSGSIAARFGSIASHTAGSNAGRLQLWSCGIDYIKQHPLMGAGYGNCKLAIVPYENTFMSGFEFNQHLHNDFIETTMELGLVGGLLFVLLFVAALMGVVSVWRSQVDDELKAIAVFSLIALGGYFIDAFFNFPCERPIMQVLFSLILAVNVSACIQGVDNGSKNIEQNKYTPSMKVFTLIAIGLMMVAGYYRYCAYQSMVGQSLTIPDFPNQATHSWQEINAKLPDIPNLDANNTPIDVVKAWYLSKEGKFDQALLLLNRSTQVNPDGLANEFVKAQVFMQLNQLDSAYYYANKGFKSRPANIGFYALLNDIYRQRRDVSSVQATFKECIKYANTVAVWDNYLSTLMALGLPDTDLLQAINAGLNVFPDDASLQEKKMLVKATSAMNSSNTALALAGFLNLAAKYPTRYNYVENVGVCYTVLKKYNQAMPYLDRVIETKAYANGKAEYFKGICLFNTGKKQEACSYLQLASAKNYAGAAAIVGTYCK